MARQSLLWTALPNRYTADGASLRLSVLLSPRLDPEDPFGQPRALSTFFPDWEDWPLTLSQGQFDISYNGRTISIAANATAGLNRVDTSIGIADSVVWKALFTSRVMVNPFKYTDLSGMNVLSYDTMTINDLVASMYGDLARTATDNLPTISQLIETDGWRNLVNIVSDLDLNSIDPDTKLRDPRRQLHRLVFRSREVPGLPETLTRFQLFHTPPSTPIFRHGTRKDDERIDARWLEYKQSSLPAPARVADTLDFHKIVAAMGSYPTLLRRLGLVVDFILDPAGFLPAAAADLNVAVRFPAGLLSIPRTNDASPLTRTRLNSTRFDAVSDTSADMPVKEGLLNIGSTRFRLLQLDVDGAGHKLMNFVRSLSRRFDVGKRVDPVTRQEEGMGAPALRTAGLTLVQRDRGGTLMKRFDANKDRNSKIEGQFAGTPSVVSLFAEDIVRGYRFDIWDSTTGQWMSLCRRQARYELSDGVVVVEPPEEESTVRIAATKSSDETSNAELHYLHEALVAWTGWSLAAPPPGRHIKADDSVDKSSDQSEAEIPPGLKFKSRFRAVKGSLPRLRFGRSYWIRARAVDLAGNSLDPQVKDFGSEHPLNNSRPYLRFEVVAPPVLALLSESGTIEKPREGESIGRIAIRTFNDSVVDNSLPSQQVSHRVAAPPQVSVREAEQHGKLDTPGKLNASLFSLLAIQKDVDPKDASAAIRKVVLPMQGPLDSSPVSTTFAVYEAGRALTYLPDPLPVEVCVRFFNHPNIAASEMIRIPLYPTLDWPEAKPFTIEVYDDPMAAPYFDNTVHQLRIPLPKGIRATVRLSMALTRSALEKMGVFSLLKPADQHWMLTPWTVLEVVHAVQRPLITPEFATLTILDRVLGQPSPSSARPSFQATCSIESTDRLDMHAEWHEPSDDAAATESQLVQVDRNRRDVAFHVKVTSSDDYADATKGAVAGGFPDHTIVAPSLIGVNTTSDERMPIKAHEFHDTRYRRIEYWLEATTRFREFLPSDLLKTMQNGEAVPTDEKIKVIGPRKVTWIPSSAPPPAPQVLYVVPTFGWKREVDDTGALSSWRRGGGLRVYLERGWNASGYGEMLAVVLPPKDFAGDPETFPASAPYKAYVTQWGNDPIWDSPFVPGLAPARNDFPLARTAPDPTGAWLPPNAPDTERDQQPGPFKVTGLKIPSTEGTGFVEVAPHDVYYDQERQLWYCDIEIAGKAAYFPFIRLALARYQPVTSPGTQSRPGPYLSNVVLADIIALTADRWLNVTPYPESRKMRVAVFGVGYEDSSGRNEANESLSLSLFSTLTGTVESKTPAVVSGSSIVEVWVEQFDPQWGNDFGWRRITNVVLSQRVPVPQASAPTGIGSIESIFGRALTAQEMVETRELTTKPVRSRFSPADVIDKISLWQTLWEGDVTLPDMGDQRLRLVIVEYEEYLVDDEQPYDKTPTKKGRRLVFVEHVELK
jgi:hypothetical protein